MVSVTRASPSMERVRAPDPDAALVAACRLGSAAQGGEAFRALHERHKDAVHRICLRITGDSHEALDAAQEAFALAFGRIAGFQARARFSRWLCAIAVRTSIEHLRRRRAVQSLSEPGAPEASARPLADPLACAELREERLHVRRALRGLSPRLRRVLVLRYFEGLSDDEIELRLAIPRGSVKSRLHRAHRAPMWRARFEPGRSIRTAAGPPA